MNRPDLLAEYGEDPVLYWTRIDPDGPGLHAPKLPGDVGWDLEAAITVTLDPNQQLDIPCNVRVRLPDNCWGEIRARSSIARKGLQVDSGVIDTGYTGPLFVLLRNMNLFQRSNPVCGWRGEVTIHQGERVGQLVLHHAYRATGVEVDALQADRYITSVRGERGFGSTGA